MREIPNPNAVPPRTGDHLSGEGRRSRFHGLLLAAGVAGLFSSMALGQETKPPPPQQDRTIIEAGEWDLGGKDGDANLFFLTGQVKIQKDDLLITAARAMVWKRPGSTRPFDELYAEGNVTFRRGTQQLRAERFWYDYATGRAYILELKGKGYSEQHKQSFYVSAREARMTMLGRIEADDIALTTCPYGVPHYHVAVGHARLVGRDPYEPEGPFKIWPFRDWRFKVEDVYPELGGAPLFFFPGILLGPWVKDFPIRSISGGRSSRFGVYVYSEFGTRFQMFDGEKDRTWGEVTVEADWREKRGGATGLDLDYKWGGYEGYIDTYYLHDNGRDSGVAFDEKFAPLTHDDRWRFHSYHRHDLDEHWRYEVETNYLSDRDLLEEFFEKEFKEAKEPETAAYVRWWEGSIAAYLYERHRLNDFQTQNEYLPRAHADLFHTPPLESVVENLYLTERLDVVHIRRRFDEDLNIESERTWRTDAYTELAYPYDLEFFQVSPFGAQRTTIYEDDLDGETEVRSMWLAGGRLTTQFHGTFPDVAWDLVGLRGLRHVVEAEARYAAATGQHAPSADVFPFEDVDRLQDFREAALEIRQRFLTRDADGKPFEFLAGSTTIEYYPNWEKETAAPVTTNYLPPFDWITLAPDASGTFGPRRWSNLHYEGTMRPHGMVRITGAGEYNPGERENEVTEIEVAVTPVPGAMLTVAQTYVRGLADAYTFGAFGTLTEKWTAGGSVQYDFLADQYLHQGLVVSRDFHDFLVQAVMERDFGRDENRFYIAFVPKFLGGSQAKAAYRRAGVTAPPVVPSGP